MGKYNHKEVIQDYLRGVPFADIQERHGIARSTVFAVLKRNYIDLNRYHSRLPYKYDHQAIIADYLAGMPLEDIAQKHGIAHRESILPILKRHGIPATRIGGPKALSMKPFNPAFFARQDATTAYWAGFLMADGSIRQDRPKSNTWALSLTLHERDIDHLFAFCDAIELDRSFVRTYESRYKAHISLMKSITVYHPSLPDSLAPWGIVPHKTYTYVAPQVSDDLLPAYLRGWLDGDGHIRWEATSQQTRCGVTGNYDALLWYQGTLQRLGFDGNINVRQAPGKCWGRLHIYGKNNLQTLIDLLHVRDSVHLPRKWQKALAECDIMSVEASVSADEP
jgi:hypothetical protein